MGFDIKARPDSDAYDTITGVRNSAGPARRSLELLLDSGTDYQLRTTVDPALMGADEVAALGSWLEEQGLRGHVWQTAREG
ncbi:hypothetical protein [Streptomyces showdoensis]|uniref:hypothetical protein n=1 Tax=Streptomyces showdoensis TaxID=68268 RepID=UPI000F4DC8BB|nr:hypothetical protein [Streptomyces showdoensis]